MYDWAESKEHVERTPEKQIIYHFSLSTIASEK